jgi:hypothetical protein
MKKLIVILALTLAVIGALFVLPASPAAASVPLQMTPMTDPMSVPTAMVPTLVPGTGQTYSTTASGQMSCPMMGGSMTGTTDLSGISGTSGMYGMGSMSGMTGMSGMGGMSGMTGMSGMGMGMSGMGSMSGMSGMGMGMSGMGSMPGMSGMGSMSGMSSMPVTGMQNVNDVLSNNANGNWFLSLNPWWILGWVVLIGLVVSLIVVGTVLTIRLVGKPKQPQAS